MSTLTETEKCELFMCNNQRSTQLVFFQLWSVFLRHSTAPRESQERRMTAWSPLPSNDGDHDETTALRLQRQRHTALSASRSADASAGKKTRVSNNKPLITASNPVDTFDFDCKISTTNQGDVCKLQEDQRLGVNSLLVVVNYFVFSTTPTNVQAS